MNTVNIISTILKALTFLLSINIASGRAGQASEYRKLQKAAKNPIEGQYMVLLKPVDDVPRAVSALLANLPGVSALYSYENAIQGVTLAGVKAPILNLLEINDMVESIFEVRPTILVVQKTSNDARL